MQRSNCGKPKICRAFLVLLCPALLSMPACEGSPESRRTEIYEMKAEPSVENIESIRVMLDDRDRDVRATALNALIGLGIDDGRALVARSLDDEDGFVRATAAKLAADLQAVDLVATLAGMLQRDSDPIVRQRAAEALKRLAGDEAALALAQALEDPVDRVRMAVVDGVAALDPTLAIPALIRLLGNDPVWEIRAEAAYALGKSGLPESFTALEDRREDSNEFVRAAISNALKLDGRPTESAHVE